MTPEEKIELDEIFYKYYPHLKDKDIGLFSPDKVKMLVEHLFFNKIENKDADFIRELLFREKLTGHF